METVNQQSQNRTLWIGLLLILLGLLSNGLFFIAVPGQKIIPWLGLLLSVIGLVVVMIGLRRAFSQPPAVRRKAVPVIVGIVSVLLFAVSLFSSYHARDLPAASGAPQVGQRAPDFSLADTTGKTVSLSELLSAPLSTGARPKAVLLVFYRGYW
jgi:hypothetical protein